MAHGLACCAVHTETAILVIICQVMFSQVEKNNKSGVNTVGTYPLNSGLLGVAVNIFRADDIFRADGADGGNRTRTP